MQKLAHEVYFFGEFRLDLTRGALFRGDAELKLRPKSFEVLTYLTENNGRLVGKDELIDHVWRGTAVTDDSLVQCLRDIRLALGDKTQEIIKTVPRRGYIFDKKVSDDVPITFVAEETSAVRIVIDHSNTHGTTSDQNAISVSETNSVESSALVRRKGLVRGFRFALWGLCTAFVFLVLFQVLLILGAMLAEYETGPNGETRSRAVELIGSLFITLTLPAVLGWLIGIGLVVFGVSRMVYGLFERDSSRKVSVIIERAIAVIISIAILALAIPNMINSYRQASKARQMNQQHSQQVSE